LKEVLLIEGVEAEGNNVEAPSGKTPTYNERMGYMEGAQDDIFAA
jgi:hypothetical protein